MPLNNRGVILLELIYSVDQMIPCSFPFASINNQGNLRVDTKRFEFSRQQKQQKAGFNRPQN